MARPPPIGEYTPQVPVEEGLRRVIPEARGPSAGPAISELGGAVERVAVSEAANYTANTLSQAQGQWTQHLQDAQQSAPPGAPGFTTGLMKNYGQYVDQAVKNAPNPLAGKLIEQHLTEFGQTLQTRALSFESQARTDHNVDVATSSVQAAGNELMMDPSVFNQRLAERSYLIDSMNLDPQTKEKLQTNASTEMARFATLGAIQRDPYAAALELHSDNPTQPYTHMLTPELREQLEGKADDALRSRLAEQEAFDRQAKAQNEAQQQSIVKQGITMSQGGKLNAPWIEQHSDVLTYEQKDFLYKELRSPVEKSDPTALVALATRVAHGEDATDDITAAMHHGLLSGTDAEHLIDQAGHEELTPYKRGVDYISKMSGTSMLNPDPERLQTQARMLDQWGDWHLAHPNATMKDAQVAYQDIVDHGMLVHLAGLPPLPFRVGPQLNPDVQGTSDAMYAAYKSGQISKQDLARDVQILNDYRDTMAGIKSNAAQPASTASAK